MRTSSFLSSAGGMNRPPSACLPWKDRAHSLGVVRLMSNDGRNPVPLTSPALTSQPDGTSIDTMSVLDCSDTRR